MKNYQTPRTLAESEFTTGYPQSQLQREGKLADYVILALVVVAAVLGFIGGAGLA